MAIYTNVVQEFRKEIEANLNLDDIIDLLIAQRIIDEKSYFEVWGTQNVRIYWPMYLLILFVVIFRHGSAIWLIFSWKMENTVPSLLTFWELYPMLNLFLML